MRISHILLICFLLLTGLSLSAQDDEDLLAALGEDEAVNYVTAAFKTNRVINLHSLENTAPGVLDFKISHRFGTFNRGIYDLFGLDNASMRLGFDFGLTDRWAIGIGRATYKKTYDGFIKYKLMRQHTGAHIMPVTVAYVATVAAWTARLAPSEPHLLPSMRMDYTHQLIIGRKFSEAASLQVTPMLVHHNLVERRDLDNDVFLLGLAARVKISKWVAVTGEYIPRIAGRVPGNFRPSLSLGFDIETGGHVFQLHFTNSTSMSDASVFTETTEDWAKGGIHFGFNISRVFTLYEPK